jgi:hypothetical protein
MSENTGLPQYWYWAGPKEPHLWVYQHPRAYDNMLTSHVPYVVKVLAGYAAYPGGNNPPNWVMRRVDRDPEFVPVLPTLEAAMVAVTVMFNANVVLDERK